MTSCVFLYRRADYSTVRARSRLRCIFFFFNDTATTEIYTLSLHDALPISNIQETKELVWNLATKDLAQQMNATAAHVAHDVSEFKIAGLTAAPSKLVNVPRVAESPVSFECKLTQIIQLQGADGNKAQAWLTLGEVVAVHIDKAMIKDGVYQTALARPIVRAGRRGDYFEIRPAALFEMRRQD